MARPTRLGYIVVPLGLLPLWVSFLSTEGAGFFVVFGTICLVTPMLGFWIGEMQQRSSPGRAAIGCLCTVAIFVFYMLWTLIAVPLIRG